MNDYQQEIVNSFTRRNPMKEGHTQKKPIDMIGNPLTQMIRHGGKLFYVLN